MDKHALLSVAAALALPAAFGQARENFLQQQAYAEMQRVSGQVDVLQSNLSDVQRRLGKLEGGGDARGIRQEIDAMKASIAELRREMQSLRGEIVRDLSGRIAKMQNSMQPAPVPERKVVVGPHLEYVVQPGDTLSLISQAFNTTIAKIKEMNGLKNDNLRVGQKLRLPK